jgi:hypothetical protein
MYLGGALFLLAIIFNFIHLGAIFWYPGAILWSVGFLRSGYWFLFQRFRYQVIGYGPVNIAGTGFIFQPPVGWTVESVTNLPLPACFGSPIGNFRPNIVFELDDLPGTIEESLARSKTISSAQGSNWAELLCQYTSTNQGCKGLRSIAQCNCPTGHMRIITYVFKRKDNTKVHIHCTSPASQGGLLDSVFDQAVANIQFN